MLAYIICCPNSWCVVTSKFFSVLRNNHACIPDKFTKIFYLNKSDHSIDSNKILSQSYLIYLTQTFGSINQIFSKVKKTIQPKTLVDSSKRVWLTEQKFGSLNQNVKRTIFF